MCGIAGKLHWEQELYDDPVVEMCNRMIYRGPDHGGVAKLENITLGHRRLSVIDLSEGANQPMVSLDGRYYIVYNGEIYNFKELRGVLIKKGYMFETVSDTEVVLYAYAEWGVECLQKFNGMFAFAIWDRKRKELFLARDRFGKKPLYYFINDRKQLTFASELTALLADKSIPQRISYEALNCYLAIGYILSPMTLYENICKLEPASYLLFSHRGDRIIRKRYWSYDEAFREKTK